MNTEKYHQIWTHYPAPWPGKHLLSKGFVLQDNNDFKPAAKTDFVEKEDGEVLSVFPFLSFLMMKVPFLSHDMTFRIIQFSFIPFSWFYFL